MQCGILLPNLSLFFCLCLLIMNNWSLNSFIRRQTLTHTGCMGLLLYLCFWETSNSSSWVFMLSVYLNGWLHWIQSPQGWWTTIKLSLYNFRMGGAVKKKHFSVCEVKRVFLSLLTEFYSTHRWVMVYSEALVCRDDLLTAELTVQTCMTPRCVCVRGGRREKRGEAARERELMIQPSLFVLVCSLLRIQPK